MWGEQVKHGRPYHLRWGPLPAGGKLPPAGSSEAAAHPRPPESGGRGSLCCPRQAGKVVLCLVKKNWGWFLEGVFICTTFKKRLACFRQPVCAKRQKELFCQRIISQSGGFPVERRMKCTVLYPCNQEEERERREKSREMGALHPEWRGSGSLNVILAGESPSGLFHIYSSAAKFMIIVLNPWQFALCPSQLCSFVTPKVLSALPCSFAGFGAKSGLCRKGSFLHWGEKQFFLNRPLPTTQKTGEGRFPEGKVTFQSRAWQKTHWGTGEGHIGRTFSSLVFHGCPDGSSEGARLCVVMPQDLLASLFRACLVPGDTGRLSLFISKLYADNM